MTRRRRPGRHGPAALLLAGTLSLGVGALVDLHVRDDRALVAQDLGAVPGVAATSAPRPMAGKIPVLATPAPSTPSDPDDPDAAPEPDPGGAAPGAELARSGSAATAPSDPPAARPGSRATSAPPEAGTASPTPSAERGPVLTDPTPEPVAARPSPRPLPAAPAPLAPWQPGLVSPLYPLPAPSRTATTPVVPAVLELPARAVTAPVDAVGTDPSGGMVVPEQVRTVGWWAPGVRPGGAAGSAVVAGHVDSRTQGLGVLSVLPGLTEGEPVLVRDAAGRTASFRVAARREYGKYDLPRDVFRRDGPPQLVLITCGGRFDPVARSYESNIVVYAVPA